MISLPCNSNYSSCLSSTEERSSVYNLPSENFKEKVYLTGLNIFINSPGDTENKWEWRISFSLRIPSILRPNLIFFLCSRDHHYSLGYISNTVRIILGTESKACKRSMKFSITRCCKEISHKYTPYQKYTLCILDARLKVLLWDNLPCYVCSETAKKPDFVLHQHLSFYSCSKLGSKYFPDLFSSDIYFSRATGNEVELSKWMEAIKTLAKYSWTLQAKHTWGLFNQRQNIFKWFIKKHYLLLLIP